MRDSLSEVAEDEGHGFLSWYHSSFHSLTPKIMSRKEISSFIFNTLTVIESLFKYSYWIEAQNLS